MIVRKNAHYDIQEKYSLPYADWKGIISIDNPYERYQACTGSTHGRRDEITVEPAFMTAKRFAAQRVAEHHKETGLNYTEIMKLTGCDRSLLCRTISGESGLCVQVSQFEKLAYNFMNISVHNLLFGEESKLVLPFVLNTIAAGMTKMDENLIDMIYEISEEAMTDQDKNNKCPITPYTMYFQNGLNLLARTNGAIASAPFKDSTPPALMTIFTHTLAEDPADPKLSTIMYAALASEMPVDFWICRHYADWVDMYYTENGETYLIENKKIKKSIENISRLYAIESNKALSAVYHIVIADMLGHKL